MKFWLKASAVALLSLLLSGQTVSTGEKLHGRIRALGEKLKCLCGCNYTVGSCNMHDCHFKAEVDEKIRGDLSAGLSEETIIDKLKKQYGAQILAAPPAEGFNLVGWVMPFIALALGLVVLRFVLARWRQQRAAPATAPGSAALDKYRDQMEKELRDLE